ncbi:MAG: hypothetical protein QOG72_1924 [Sphingomonadales bacterium]|jgi:hypothetical protein|nr:hypothetical protein [Sphingomonadales bacterium]
MTKHDYHWTFGNQAHISFPGGVAPVAEPPHAFTSLEGCATLSDALGNLVCYTDGTGLYSSLSGPALTTTPPTLGGTPSSTQSAIIVPPAGGGTRHHIFAVGDWSTPSIGPVSHTTFKLAPVAILSQPTALTAIGPQRAAERLAAVPHKDCSKYWVIAMDGDPPSPVRPGLLHALLVDSDGPPTVSVTTPCATSDRFAMKFSQDGNRLAVASVATIEIYDFNRATGQFTLHSTITGLAGNRAYGLEFSPNGLYLYFSCYQTGAVRRHTINGPNTFNTCDPIDVWPANMQWSGNYRIGALQLGPNGKIYGAKFNHTSLFEIGLPDSPTTASNAVQFKAVATKAGGGDLVLNQLCQLGLPTFTQRTADCADNCRNLAAAVDEQIVSTPKVNTLRPCDKSQPIEKPPCAPLDLPKIAPWTSIKWGDSQCDCIEGDDTEVMHLTVCNPYSNLTLSNLTIHQLVVVDANGNPPPLLPDGSPSVQLVPIGPYCFDDLAPCTCVTREFVLRLRGAVPGPYHILVKGICFDACFHGDEQDCFIFNVCKD